MAQNSVKALELSSIASSGIGAAYLPINGTGFAKPIFFLRIVNGGSTAVTISYDGVTDNEYIPVSGVFELSAQNNSQPAAQIALFSARTIVYIKGTAGTGSIYVSGYYV